MKTENVQAASNNHNHTQPISSTADIIKAAGGFRVTTKQAAELLGVTRQYVDKLVKAGGIKRVDGRIEVRELLRHQEVKRGRGRPAKGCPVCGGGDQVEVMRLSNGLVRVDMCEGCLGRLVG